MEANYASPPGFKDLILSPRRDEAMVPVPEETQVSTWPALDPYDPSDTIGFVRYRVTTVEYDRLKAIYADASGATSDYRIVFDPSDRFQIGANEIGDPILCGTIV